MLEEIMNRQHLEKALLQVERNKGVGGIDGMQTDELRDYLNANYQALRQSVLTGNYEPSPVKKVEIPKPQGGVRMLGIPTVIDRLLQQAISQWLNQFSAGVGVRLLDAAAWCFSPAVLNYNAPTKIANLYYPL